MTIGIESVFNVGSISSIDTAETFHSGSVTNDNNFSNWLTEQIDNLNDMALRSDAAVNQVSSGKVENLHQIIMDMEKSKQSFELAVQVRNKLLEGYQEILRMQV